MIKTAITRHPVIELIKNRWSARAFSDQNLTDEHLLTLVEAASWAPSSINEQPWRYRYGLRGSALFEQMWDCLLIGNQPWAKNAAALMVCTAKKTFTKNGKTNRHAMHDTGMANAFLILQATDMGIYGHIMAGYDPVKLRETFHLSDDEEDLCVIALGFLGTPDQLEEPFRTREVTPRSRRAVDDFVLEN
ncbi:MAG: nitroreductase family protein [Phycisphaerae bacterium]|nr:nitroreductase family protein [Saprospiraceae bacterium]